MNWGKVMGDGGEGTERVVRAAMQTDVGTVRTRNEDAAYVDPRGRFFVLADGMGGRDGGDVASATAVDVVRTILESAAHELAAFAARPTAHGRRRMCALVDRAVRDANDVVCERGRVEPEHAGMGTTLEVAVVLAREVFVAHVGDSRTYLIRDGGLRQLTEDQTMATLLARSGTISENDARSSPLRSMLTNAIGCLPTVAIEHVHVELAPGDRLLLCSDGLHDYFTPDELEGVVCEGTAEAAIGALVALARGRGGHDNITGIVVEIPVDAVPEPIEDTPTIRVSAPIDPIRVTLVSERQLDADV